MPGAARGLADEGRGPRASRHPAVLLPAWALDVLSRLAYQTLHARKRVGEMRGGSSVG